METWGIRAAGDVPSSPGCWSCSSSPQVGTGRRWPPGSACWWPPVLSLVVLVVVLGELRVGGELSGVCLLLQKGSETQLRGWVAKRVLALEGVEIWEITGRERGWIPQGGPQRCCRGGAGLGQPRCRWGAAWEGPSTLQGIAVYWRRKSAAESSAVTTQAGTRPGEGFAPRPQPSACKLLGFCAKPCPPVPTGPAGVPFCRSQLGGRAAAPRRVLGPSQDRSRALQQPPNWGAPGEPGGDTAATAQKAPALWGEGFGDGDGDKQTSLRSFPGQVPAGKRRGCVLG